MKEKDHDRPAVVIAFPKEHDPNKLTWDEVRARGLHGEPDDDFELYDDENLMGGDNGQMLIIREAADGTIISSRPYGPKPTAVVLSFRPRRYW